MLQLRGTLWQSKTLCALAALAATASFAQSSVSISGNVDVGYRARTGVDDPTAKFGKVQVNNTSTTALFFKGTEDLGGGLKANFLMELDFNPTQSQTGDGTAVAQGGAQFFNGTPFNGEQFLGLEGGFGNLRLGSPNAGILEAALTSTPFGTALGGGYMNTGVNRLGSATGAAYGVNQYVGGVEAAGRVIRYERAIRYDTPVFNGFKAALLYSGKNGNQTNTAQKAYDNTNGVQEITLAYNNGPLNVVASSSKIEAGNNAASSGIAINTSAPVTGSAGTATMDTATALAANASIKYNFLGANYNFGALTVYGGLTSGKHSVANTMDATSSNIAAKYQINPTIAVMANYVKVDDKTTNNKDAKLTGLGLDYSLSKRTTAYVRYEKGDTNTNSSGATTSGAYTTSAVGLRHTF